MKILGRLLLFIYFLILILWIMNSQYLFSFWGITLWVLIILVGFVMYKKLSNFDNLKNLVKISNYIMLFLVALTAAIFYITTSMPF
jgi:hypothetical protein